MKKLNGPLKIINTLKILPTLTLGLTNASDPAS
jgi:hypothetical protein